MKFVISCTLIAVFIGFLYGMKLGYMGPVLVPLVSGFWTVIGSTIIYLVYDFFKRRKNKE